MESPKIQSISFENRPDIQPDDYFKFSHNRDRLAFLAALAGLAPSSHNTQPWIFKIVENGIEVHKNPARSLPGSDPNGRQFFLSIGAAIENLVTAANAYGYESNFTYSISDGPKTGMLTIRALPSSNNTYEKDTITAIIKRANNRSPYRADDPPVGFLEEINHGVDGKDVKVDTIRNPEMKSEIVRLVGDSIEEIFHNARFCEELSHWIRPSFKRYRDGMPGYNIGIPWILSLAMPFMMRFLNMAKIQRKMNEDALRATPNFFVISTKEDKQKDWINAGRLLERIALTAQKYDLVIGVLAAPIQLEKYRTSLAQLLKTDFHPQVFMRVGYPTIITPPSPRLESATIIR